MNRETLEEIFKEYCLWVSEKNGTVTLSYLPKFIGQKFEAVQFKDDDEFRQIVAEIAWNLLSQGILVPKYQPLAMGWSVSNWDQFLITSYGRMTLEQKLPNPHFKQAYMGYLEEIHDLDSVVRRYVVEAIECFQANRHLSCTLALGIAAERLIDVVCDRVANLIAAPDLKQKFVEKAGRGTKFSQKLKAIKDYRDRLNRKVGEAPSDLDYLLYTVDIVYRLNRNDKAHPLDSVSDVTREQAYMYLGMFPEVCKRMYAYVES